MPCRLTLFLCLCFSIIGLEAGIIVQEGSTTLCSRNVPCKWAICRPMLETDPSQPLRCEVIPNGNCMCPEETQCRLTNIIQPFYRAVKLHYRCLSD